MAQGLSEFFVWLAVSDVANVALTVLLLFGAACVVARMKFEHVS